MLMIDLDVVYEVEVFVRLVSRRICGRGCVDLVAGRMGGINKEVLPVADLDDFV